MTKSTGGDDPALRLLLAAGVQGGRVKVYGCSPGCLLVSLAVSVLLTLAVNGCMSVAG